METLRTISHPILGSLVLRGSVDRGITALDFALTPPDTPHAEDSLLIQAEELLQRYLLGEAVDFSVLPLRPEGTPFQQAVWQSLLTIPWGETRSYKWLAEQLGKPNAVRAVGQANGKNPIPILIPCHRVIQHNGNLGGYSGGLHVKHFLLSMEQHRPRQIRLDLGDVLRPTRPQTMTLL